MGAKIVKISATNDEISGRVGLSPILRYLKKAYLFSVIISILTPKVKVYFNGLQLGQIFVQIFAFFFYGTDMTMSGFDTKKTIRHMRYQIRSPGRPDAPGQYKCITENSGKNAGTRQNSSLRASVRSSPSGYSYTINSGEQVAPSFLKVAPSTEFSSRRVSFQWFRRSSHSAETGSGQDSLGHA